MSSLSRLTGALTVALGLFVAAFALSRAFAAMPPPMPLTFTLLGAAILFVSLGVGVMRRSRVAWAFAAALTAVSTAAMLLAVPWLLRSGLSLPAVLGALVVVGVLLALLIVGGKEMG